MIELEPGWLAVELDSVDEEMAHWPDGLAESFNSLRFQDDESE